MAEDGETSKLVQGWFYYEVVKVKGNSGKTYLMLDRNLGASNNGPYIRETRALRKRKSNRWLLLHSYR